MAYLNRLLRKAARLKWHFEAMGMLALAWFCVKVLPFKAWRGMIGPIEQKQIANQAELTPAARSEAITVGRWVRRTAHRAVFKPVCLPQAMAGYWMLRRRKIAGQIFIGTRKEPETGDYIFHAWLMYGDTYLTGYLEGQEFVSLGRADALKPSSLS